MSSQMCENYSTELEAAVNGLVNLRLQVSYTYLSLGIYFDRNYVALETTSSVRCKTNTAAAPSSRRCRSHPKRSKALDAMEAAMVLEKNMNQALLDPLPSL
eukprot:bmy_10775T0